MAQLPFIKKKPSKLESALNQSLATKQDIDKTKQPTLKAGVSGGGGRSKSNEPNFSNASGGTSYVEPPKPTLTPTPTPTPQPTPKDNRFGAGSKGILQTDVRQGIQNRLAESRQREENALRLAKTSAEREAIILREKGFRTTEVRKTILSGQEEIKYGGIQQAQEKPKPKITFDESGNPYDAQTGKRIYVVEDATPKTRLESVERNIRLARGEGGYRAFLAGVGASVTNNIRFGQSLLTQPTTTFKNVIKGIYGTGKKVVTGEGFPEVGRILKQEPQYATGYIASEILTAKAIGVTGEAVTNQASKLRTILSPKYSPLKEGSISNIKAGNINVLEKYDLPGRRTLDIPIAEKIPTLSLKQQVSLAGTSQDLVSGSKNLFSVFRRNVKIDKPIPGQETLKKATQAKIENIEQLSATDIAKLNAQVKKETGSKGLLEKTFFVDPLGRLRPSRLGLKQNRASILDILSGDFTFRKTKPQAILFEKNTIARIPKSLQKTFNKIKFAQALTNKEYGAILKFQFAKTGEFKPVGFITKEAEAVATGDIKRLGIAGRTIIEGKSVEIIRAKLLEPKESKALRQALEFEDFNKASKITGFRASELKSYTSTSKPSLSLSYSIPSLGYSLTKLSRPSKSTSYTTSKPSSYKLSIPTRPKPTYTSKPTYTTRIPGYSKPTYKTPTYPGKPGSPKYPGKIPPRLTPPIKNPPIPRFLKEQMKLKQPSLSQGFRTFVIKNRMKKYIGTGLTKGRALELGERYTTKNLRATFGIEKSGLTKQKDISYKVNPKLFRGYKIKQGKKIKLDNIFIQRKGKRLVGRGEVEELISSKRRKNK